jgi:hypothetical protein
MAEKQKPKKWKRAAKSGGKKSCKVENCKRPYRAKGYCWFHYAKWRRGDLKKPRQKGAKKTAETKAAPAAPAPAPKAA